MYDQLELASDQKVGGFKYDPKEDLYYLPDFFHLTKEIYTNLYPH